MRRYILLTVSVFLVLASGAWAQQAGGQAGTAGKGFISPTPTPDLKPYANPPALSEPDRERLEKILDQVHRPGPPLPKGPSTAPEQEGIAPKPVPPTIPQSLPANLDPKVFPPADFVLYRNTSMGGAAPTNFKSTVSEPNADGYGNTIVQTGNWYIAYSGDGGVSFAFINPFDIMAGIDGGFCCDQIATYDPGRDLFFLLMPSVASGTTHRNTLRLIVVRGFRSGDFAVFTYDIVPQTFGIPLDQWFDYPKLVVGKNHVYLTANMFGPAPCVSCLFKSSIIARLPLDPLKAGASFSFNFVQDATVFNFTVAEGIGEVAYWATHLTTGMMRIYSWSDDSASFSSFDRTVPTWDNSTRICIGPDGRPWCGRLDGRIIGAYLRDRSDEPPVDGKELGFMWSSAAQPDVPSPRPQPYVRVARFAVNGLALIDAPDIWNADFAFAYAYAAPNASGGLGVSLFFGGGLFFPTHAVCISDDLSAVPPPWECVTTATSTQGPALNKWGDYDSVRPHWPRANTWRATGFRLNGGGDGNNIDPHYIEFGRGRDLP